MRGKPGFSCCAPLQPTEVFHAGRPGRPGSNPPPSSSSCGALGIHRASLKLSFLICYIMPVSQIFFGGGGGERETGLVSVDEYKHGGQRAFLQSSGSI